MRILIVRLSALGDVTTGLAVLASLKAACPEAFIGWLVEDRCADLHHDPPQIDQLHVFESQLKQVKDLTHVRLDIFPDGGVARLRLLGLPTSHLKTAKGRFS